MTIKVLVFDCDGILYDSCNIHYDALNQSLQEHDYDQISEIDHREIYNGLSTKSKLQKMDWINPLLRDKIYSRKQEITKILFNQIKVDQDLINLLKKIKALGYKIHCASNCISETLHLILKQLGVINLFDNITSNQDVANPKPSPEIYYKSLIKENVSPDEVLIFEDSLTGITSAMKSNCNVCHIKNRNYLTFETIMESIDYFQDKTRTLTKTPFKTKLTVVIPMAGNGSRFSRAGYIKPKPLIDVIDRPMIAKVIHNIGIDANYIFIVKKDHIIKYNVDSILRSIVPYCHIIEISETTEGAACTVLLAKEFINDTPLLISNCDQYIEWENDAFTDLFSNFLIRDTHLDAVISTFTANHPKWSYAKLNDKNYVTEVAEKRVISNNATTGMYLWRNGSDFVKYAEQMISKNIRTNNEFYVCPVFNEAILDNKLIGISQCKKMHSLGVPEDLEIFITNSKY
jgi:HAD superfamily hydrolase (TIGR01509 family)